MMVKNTRVGDILVARGQCDEDGRGAEWKKYQVVAVYPGHVRTVCTKNKQEVRCFTYGDLVMMKKEVQKEEEETVMVESGQKGPRHTYTRTARYGRAREM